MSHPDEIELMRLVDGETDVDTAERLKAHLAGCQECSGSVALLGQIRQAVQVEHEEAKEAVAPPRWDSWSRLTGRGTGGRSRWLAVAASVVLAVGSGWWLLAPRRLQAASLLARAVAVEKASPRRAQKLRVVSGGRTFLRPRIVAREEGDPELRGLFESARYGWDDPLSATAFAEWREQLRQKDEAADMEAGHYRIRTTTGAGPLTEATLLLTADLHAVRCVLRFGENRTVEFEEAPEVLLPPVARTEPAPPGTASSIPVAASVADELELALALHRIGADLGDPVEWQREGGRIVVTATGLTAQRVRELRDATAHIATIEWRVEDAPAPSATPPPRSPARPTPRTPGVLAGEIERRTGRNAADEIDGLLATGDALVARAHALRLLTVRFDATRAAELDAPRRTQLGRLRRDHAAALVKAADRLAAAVPGATATGAGAIDVLDAARRVDELLNTIFAMPDGDTASNATDLRTAIARLTASAHALEAQ